MIFEKELSVFQADCCGFGPPKVKTRVKLKNTHISENTAKLTNLKAVYCLKF